MSEIERSTAEHYTQRNLYESIIAALKRMGKTPDQVTAEDLAPVDSFHIRGRTATLELGRLARLGPGDAVLDVGCGLGGSARHLAQAFGCRVTGLDLTPEYIATAEKLANASEYFRDEIPVSQPLGTDIVADFDDYFERDRPQVEEIASRPIDLD